MLTICDVTKDYGKFRALEGVSLELQNGLYGLLAPNGAGKTTLIKMIVTLLFPTSGEILYNGEDIFQMGADYRSLIGYLPQRFGYYKNNTPRQYLDYLAALKGLPAADLAEKISAVLAQVGLADSEDTKMRKFSGGMLQRVGIAQAILGDPKILILDEPTAGLDPKERVRFRNILSALSKDRIVILSTHIVSDIESIANQVILLKEKTIHRLDTVAGLCAELEGKVFEAHLEEREYDDLKERFLILSARQEKSGMTVRFFAGQGEESLRQEGPFAFRILEDASGDAVGARPRETAKAQDAEGCGCVAVSRCAPNLEDVFLVTYQ